MHRILLLLGCALLAWPSVGAQSGILYASNLSTNSLGTLDRVTGAFTPIGVHGTGSITGLAWDANHDVLYGVSPNNNALYVIDQTTGVGTLIGPTGFSNVNALAYDPNSDTLYGTDLNTPALFSVDVTTGAGTLIGMYPSTMSIEGLAYDPITNLLYGLEDNADTVVVIDRTSGSAVPLASPIGITGISRGLDYDTELNVIWETIVNPGRLVRVDPVTGTGTFVASIPTFVQGIAFKGPLTSAQYQVNQLEAAIDIDGIQGTAIMPATVTLGIGQTGMVSVTSTLTGQPWELGIGTAPLITAGQGAYTTSDGQILNLFLADPTLTFVFTGFQSPPFLNFGAPVSSTIALGVSIQMGVLDPNAPSGVRLSQPVRLIVQ